MNNVKFLFGTNDEYNSIVPSDSTFYRVESDDDDKTIEKVYLGTELLSNNIDLEAINERIKNIEDFLEQYEDEEFFFKGYTFNEVQTIVSSGEAQNIWSIGEISEPIKINGIVGKYNFENEKIRCCIIGFDHNPVLETDNRYSMTCQFGVLEDGTKLAFVDDGYDSTGSTAGFRMNITDTNAGGWQDSYMRNTVCEEFFNALPASLQNIIKATTKYTDNVGNWSGSIESNVTATEDKIFLLSYHEVGGTNTFANSYEANYTEPYSDYYGSDSDRIRYRHSAIGDPSDWWERSVYQYSSSEFCYVRTNGSTSYYTLAGDFFGFAPTFNIISSNFNPVKTWTIEFKLCDSASGEELITDKAQFELEKLVEEVDKTGNRDYLLDKYLNFSLQEETNTYIYTGTSDSSATRVNSINGQCIFIGLPPTVETFYFGITMVTAPDAYDLWDADGVVALYNNGTAEDMENKGSFSFSIPPIYNVVQNEPYNITIYGGV